MIELMARKKHIVIDARIRRASTGRPVTRLLDNLQESDGGYRYTVVLEAKDDWQPTNNNFTVVKSRFGNYSFNPLNQVLYAIQLYKLKPDLVHFTLTTQQPLFYFGKQTTFSHDLTMLKFVRAERLPGWLHAIRMRGYKLLLWSAHKKAKHILVPSQFVADNINKHHLFTNRKTTVALESSDPPLPGRAIEPKIDPGRFIMYTGSTFPHKNIERLISAFYILKEQHPDLKLVLVGKREYHSKKLEKWAKRQSHETSITLDADSKHLFFDDIIFTGFIPDEELKWYYQNAQAYVFPSLSEGFGLPGLEAMVHGCPVVSSNFTSLPEVHGEAAHYFNPMDLQDIVTKIDEVISNEKLRKNLIIKGYKNAKRFSWKKMAVQTLDIYKSALKD
jgi:glycosyltransferase involved in cell wall biosynthesis